MKSQKITVIASVICLAATFGSVAQEKKQKMSPDKMFAKFDSNEDGELTKEELEGKKILARFDKLDQDADGSITLEEFKSGMKKKGKGKGKKGKKGKKSNEEGEE